ncbi:MAG: hypothetical protein WAX69_10925 [Victivallales bacterium]
MTRTTIVLPEDIKKLAVKNAQDEGISFGEFVRRSLEMSIGMSDSGSKTYSRECDSLFSGMRKLRLKAKPSFRDGALNHDEYLYGNRRNKKSGKESGT